MKGLLAPRVLTCISCYHKLSLDPTKLNPPWFKYSDVFIRRTGRTTGLLDWNTGVHGGRRGLDWPANFNNYCFPQLIAQVRQGKCIYHCNIHCVQARCPYFKGVILTILPLIGAHCSLYILSTRSL